MEMVRRDAINQHLMTIMRKLCSHENLIALALCLLIILLVIVTTDSAPQWIYQGF